MDELEFKEKQAYMPDWLFVIYAIMMVAGTAMYIIGFIKVILHWQNMGYL